ncbi:MAG: sigma-70 family RNA polymerase sigma factor [Bacteroidota bacterium]
MQPNLTQLFRTEYSKLVAVLCKHFGLTNIQLAEDIVSDTFIAAAETWGKKGLPDNPTAWLYTVAKNKTRDQMRRKKVFQEKIQVDLQHGAADSTDMELDFSTQHIQDSQLQMIFAICHPSVSEEAQIGLALRILCGFGIDEIADAFLANKATINKRLFRAKEKLRKANIAIAFPEEKELPGRLTTVLRTLYLLFNEGYYSISSNKSLRKDLCLEAMRLNYLLTQYETTDQPQVNALLSLMCFHASRFEARLDDSGVFVLYEDQDTSRWDDDLKRQGEHYLNRSSTGEAFTKYHLEAAIAFWHTEKEDTTEKWEQILQLYNYLLQIEYSPAAALNRTYALAKAESREKAIAEAKKIDLASYHFYHCLLAELYGKEEPQKALAHLNTALNLAKSEGDKQLIQRKIDVLNKRHPES